MPNYNKVILMGNLTRDPELRYTPNGQAVADIGLAINRRRRSQDGERRDETTFVTVTAWGRQAEVINEYFSKGRPIFIEGRLQLDEWTTQDGQRRSRLKVILERFEFVTSRDDSGPSQPRSRPAPQKREQSSDSGSGDDFDSTPDFDDVPF